MGPYKERKQYVIWYNGGSGGFMVSWMVQLCIDPTKLNLAFENFPNTLKDNNLVWQKYEKVPPNVGLMCNAFSMSIIGGDVHTDQLSCVKKLLNKIVNNQPGEIYETFRMRAKYFLVNHVYGKGHATTEDYNLYSSNIEKYGTNDVNYFKKQTNVLFELDKHIFVRSPMEYQQIAQKTKQSRNISFDDSILDHYPTLKCFQIRAIWEQTYIAELEKVIGKKISTDSQHAIKVLVDHYIDISPPELRKYCEEQWNI